MDKSLIEKLSIEEKIGQMLCFAFKGDAYDDQIRELVEEIKVGGVIYFARNIKNIPQSIFITSLKYCYLL